MAIQKKEAGLTGTNRSSKEKENTKNKKATSEEPLSSPVCYANSKELRPEFLNEQPEVSLKDSCHKTMRQRNK